MLEDCIQETISEQNKLAAGSDRSVANKLNLVKLALYVRLSQFYPNVMPVCFIRVGFRLMAIQQCDLVLVHIYPQGEETLVSDRPKKEVGETPGG